MNSFKPSRDFHRSLFLCPCPSNLSPRRLGSLPPVIRQDKGRHSTMETMIPSGGIMNTKSQTGNLYAHENLATLPFRDRNFCYLICVNKVLLARYRSEVVPEITCAKLCLVLRRQVERLPDIALSDHIASPRMHYYQIKKVGTCSIPNMTISPDVTR